MLYDFFFLNLCNEILKHLLKTCDNPDSSLVYFECYIVEVLNRGIEIREC